TLPLHDALPILCYSVLHDYGHMGTPTRRWNALSVLSGALGEPSRAPLKFLSVRPDVLYSYGYHCDWSATTSFPNDIISGISHFWTLRFLFHSLYITIPPYLKPKHIGRRWRT